MGRKTLFGRHERRPAQKHARTIGEHFSGMYEIPEDIPEDQERVPVRLPTQVGINRTNTTRHVIESIQKAHPPK